MQEAVGEKSLVLLRVGKQTGHGAGKSTSQWVEEAANMLAFLKKELALDDD
jgi:prolyl oligopeptidase PreP (S9A serine peptidase family)